MSRIVTDPNKIKIAEDIKSIMENLFSKAIGSKVKLNNTLAVYDTDTISNKEVLCVSFIFDQRNVEQFPWLEDLIIWIVPEGREVSILKNSTYSIDTIVLPCMTDEERHWAEDDNLTTTVEVERITIDDIKSIVSKYIDVNVCDDPLANEIVKKAKAAAGEFFKIVPINGDYRDSKLIVLNIFVRGQFLGFIDVFIDRCDEPGIMTLHSVRADLTDKFNPVMEKKVFTDIEPAVRFIISSKNF